METTFHRDVYLNQLGKLGEIIDRANERIVSEPPDPFFHQNTNFFTKSFLVIMCAYLESYLKDALMVIVEDSNEKLSSTKLPHNLIRWSLNKDKEIKDVDLKYEPFKLSIKKKELDDFISGSPYRTKDLFKKFGIELDKDETFNSQKELINSIVSKRNRIVHHNDDASDISNADLKAHIAAVSDYIRNIDLLICKQLC